MVGIGVNLPENRFRRIVLHTFHKDSMKNKKAKILVILGPTATGKSDLAVKIAKKWNGEIISADSRQVYRGLNIGTGKITKGEMLGVRHHMLDVISPKKVFSVSDWKKQTEKIISEIISREKLPIICGGTGFYIQAVVDNIILPEVPPNKKLRKDLEKKTKEELFSILIKLDHERAGEIDKNNPVRLIRAIEIVKALGKVPKIRIKSSEYRFLQIGLKTRKAELKLRIRERLISRFKKGMIKEAKNLYKNGLALKRMRELGLEYKYLADYLENKLTKSELIQKLETEIWRYSKRQITWFKRDKRIKWFKPTETNKIEQEIKAFLT